MRKSEQPQEPPRQTADVALVVEEALFGGGSQSEKPPHVLLVSVLRCSSLSQSNFPVPLQKLSKLFADTAAKRCARIDREDVNNFMAAIAFLPFALHYLYVVRCGGPFVIIDEMIREKRCCASCLCVLCSHFPQSMRSLRGLGASRLFVRRVCLCVLSSHFPHCFPDGILTDDDSRDEERRERSVRDIAGGDVDGSCT